MTITAQNRAIRSYRSRLQKQGLARFEVIALSSDRDLIRSLAKRLAHNDTEATKIRSQLRQAVVDEEEERGGIFAALRNSPLVGAEIQFTRSKETGRKVDL
jgi:hypothetical protein